MEDNKVYFVVVLIDRTGMDFDRKCDYIDRTDDNLCLFLHKKDDDEYNLLAAIPYNQIRYIKRCEGE